MQMKFEIFHSNQWFLVIVRFFILSLGFFCIFLLKDLINACKMLTFLYAYNFFTLLSLFISFEFCWKHPAKNNNNNKQGNTDKGAINHIEGTFFWNQWFFRRWFRYHSRLNDEIKVKSGWNGVNLPNRDVDKWSWRRHNIQTMKLCNFRVQEIVLYRQA